MYVLYIRVGIIIGYSLNWLVYLHLTLIFLLKRRVVLISGWFLYWVGFNESLCNSLYISIYTFFRYRLSSDEPWFINTTTNAWKTTPVRSQTKSWATVPPVDSRSASILECPKEVMGHMIILSFLRYWDDIFLPPFCSFFCIFFFCVHHLSPPLLHHHYNRFRPHHTLAIHFPPPHHRHRRHNQHSYHHHHHRHYQWTESLLRVPSLFQFQ